MKYFIKPRECSCHKVTHIAIPATAQFTPEQQGIGPFWWYGCPVCRTTLVVRPENLKEKIPISTITDGDETN